MNGFNFLEADPASRAARLAKFGFGARARRTLAALLLAAILLAAGAGIERLRLGYASAAALRGEARLARADEAMRGLRTSVATVERLSAVSRALREVQASGEKRARAIAEIAARLPEKVWLGSLECDDTGATLKGGSRDYEALGDAIARLSKAQAYAMPVLVASRLHDSDWNAGSSVDFELRLQQRAP